MKGSGFELEKMQVPRLPGTSTDWDLWYGSPDKGHLHYSLVDNSLYFWNGTEWKTIETSAVVGGFLARDGSTTVTGDWNMAEAGINFFYPSSVSPRFALREDAEAGVGVGTGTPVTYYAGKPQVTNVGTNLKIAVNGALYVDYVQSNKDYTNQLYLAPGAASPAPTIYARAKAGFTGALGDENAWITYGRLLPGDVMDDDTYRHFTLSAGIYINQQGTSFGTRGSYEVPFGLDLAEATIALDTGVVSKAGIRVKGIGLDKATTYMDGHGIEGIGNVAEPYLWLNKTLQKPVMVGKDLWVQSTALGTILKLNGNSIQWTPTTQTGTCLTFPRGSTYGVASGGAGYLGQFDGLPQGFLKSLMDLSKSISVTYTYNADGTPATATVTGDTPGTIAYTYDPATKLLIREDRVFFGLNRRVSYGYNVDGYVTTVTVTDF